MFCINVLLKVRDPADAPEIRQLLAQAAQWSRAEAGCLRFEVYQSQNQPECFLLCEQWESQAAWEAHRQERAFTEIYQPRVLPRVERTPYICDLVSE
jgi:quinol monooxygenase YgiN